VAQEKTLTRNELPAPVQKTVATLETGATVRGFSTEVEGGKRLYEAALTVNGHSRAVSMDAMGNVLEVEDEVALTSLSAVVQAGLKRKAGSGVIVTVESLTKGGKVVAYEAVVRRGGKESEVQVGPDGKDLAHEE
jgi:uncharacterized membrane protein YkoI